MQYTENELLALIADVEKEFTTHLVKAEQDLTSKLAKSEDSEKPEPKEEKEEPKEESKEAPAKEESKEIPTKEESKEAPKKEEAVSEHQEEVPEQNAAPEQEKSVEDHGYDEEDLAHMHKMYASMSKGELKAHHDAVRQALDGHMAKCGDMSMNKTETMTSIEIKPEVIVENPELGLVKSELEAQKAKNDELKKNLDTVQEILTKLVKKVPQGKAITTLEAITKNESISNETKELTKSEIKETLFKKASDPELKKSDRDAINAYFLNGANINTISHLLK
jgi:hypothetical protein